MKTKDERPVFHRLWFEEMFRWQREAKDKAAAAEECAAFISKVRHYEAVRGEYPLITCVLSDARRRDQLLKAVTGSLLVIAVMGEFETLKDSAFRRNPV